MHLLDRNLARSTAWRLAALAVSMVPWPAAAQWQITPSVEVGESFTDNVRLRTNGREADWITTVKPGLTIAGQGARVKADANLGLTYSHYLNTRNFSGISNNVLGSGQVTVLQDSVFLDGQAFSTETLVDPRGEFSVSDRPTANNRRQVTGFTLGPSWRYHLGSWASSEVRYRYGVTRFSTPSVGSSTAPATDLASDSTSQQFQTSLTGGPDFNRFGWKLYTDNQVVDRSRGEFERNTYGLNTSYVIVRSWSALANAGYEEIRDPTIRSNIDGLFWSVGPRFTPNERLALSVTYGRRFDNPNYSADLSYLIGPRTTLRASYFESVETTQSLLSGDIQFLARDPSGVLIDTRTGLPFNLRDSTFSLRDTAFRQKRFQSSLTAIRGRNTYTLSLSHTTRDTDFGGSAGSAQANRGDTSMAATGVITRALWQNLNGSVNLGLTRLESNNGTASDSTILRGGASLGYTVSDSVTTTLSYAYLNRSVKNPNLTPTTTAGNTGDVVENLFAVSVRKLF